MKVSNNLQNIIPNNLTNYRTARYEGDGFNVTLKDFVPEDAALIVRVYNTVKKIYDLWLYMKDAPNYELMGKQIEQLGSDRFLRSVHAIGSATYDLQEPTPLLRKVIHDVRGGGLSVLIGLATLLNRDTSDKIAYIKQSITAACDHAKLMRNAIEDIDPLVREADESIKVHPVTDFVDKWRDLEFAVSKTPVKVEVECTFEGNVTNRCLETSSIDRILYNYINNAARFTVDNRVRLTILPVGDNLVRWVVQNSISERQKDWLHEKVGENLGDLFRGGITRGGHGIGLSNCADFVAAAFGTRDADEAIEQKYLGAHIIDDQYYAWFHWPAYFAQPSDPICEC
ncbi:MAG: HAMP domain-containing histidine kinase [Anaerolineae bacterium]|nr:HAMP domain-containing histidine kinase [Anaerolineae bacterium]